MIDYDKKIRAIADDIREVLNNCTDAPRLLREYAGLLTEKEVDGIVEARLELLQEEIERLREERNEARERLSAAKDALMD